MRSRLSRAGPLEVKQAAQAAVMEALRALRLNAGAVWLWGPAAVKQVHSSGLEGDQMEEFATRTGPTLEATGSAVGMSESPVANIVAGD